MAEVTIGGAVHVIAPYKLRELRAAAPFIDRVLAQRTALSSVTEESFSFEKLTDSVGDALSIIAIGILRAEGVTDYTPKVIAARAHELEGETSLPEISGLSGIVDVIMTEAGMRQSRPTSPGAGASPSPSVNESTESSQSSSQPDAPAETGTE